ncbi:MAG: NTP transferase domain-containing protein, partial [Gammaproteobacteria bacterium]|nr:NTP transferase domain-containing protein [Gammaproteobacteria bacterium]
MATSRQKNIFGVLLAAGTGSRFGGGKLSADLNGQSLLQHAVGPLSAVFR